VKMESVPFFPVPFFPFFPQNATIPDEVI